MLGSQVVFVHETKGNREYIRNRPRKIDRSKRSESQVKHVLKFYVGGTQYWKKAVKGNPDLLKAYTAVAVSPRNAYNMAMKDYMSDPVIDKVTMNQLKTNHYPIIHIRAKDVIGVRTVFVSIVDNDGKLLEKGEAIQNNTTDDWKYTCSVINNPIPELIVGVAAYDFPGNKTVVVKAFHSGIAKGNPVIGKKEA
jgi:uncharacterized protein YegJ (DUF2314 family)